MMRVVTVVGARPQFVKASVVSRVIADAPGITEILVHTGQHYDASMSQVFFDELRIRAPDHHLGIGSASHGAQTGAMLAAIEEVLVAESPDWLLVYGDTNSTLAGALAAAKLHIPVAHVEAGLRSFNRRMPEEVNRVLSDHLSELLFAPTAAAVSNLEREGLGGSRVRLVGDVMMDAALHYARAAEETSTILERLALEPLGYVAATIHRAENTDDPERLEGIIEGLLRVAERIPVVLPLHPRTRAALERRGWLERAERQLRVMGPAGYLDFTRLVKDASLVVTDSGGVQKEAFFHGVRCVTLRDETEWVELVEHGWNCLVPHLTAERIEEAVGAALDGGDPGEPRPPLYGNGDAGERIVRALEGGS